MPASKIQDEQEIIRWFEEGVTYEEMSRRYLERYNIETVPSLFSNFRRRRGLTRRINRDDDLIPWAVKSEHRWAYPLQMLRAEGRRRAGMPVRESEAPRLNNWLQMLQDEDAVVHYDPETKDGFFYVRREPGDVDIIRRPLVKTTQRHNAD